jgi:phage shock protein C
MNDRLYRSVDDRFLAGVCGGLADRLAVDPSLVRIAWVLLTVASGGLFLLVYIVMAIVVPEEEDIPVFPAQSPWPPGVAADTGPAAASATESGETAAVPGTAPSTPGMPASPAQPTSYWVAPGASQSRAQARAERRAARAAARASRPPGQAGLILGVILILLGGWFLLEQYVPAFDPNRFWPFIVIGLGVVLLAFAFGGRAGGKPEGQP